MNTVKHKTPVALAIICIAIMFMPQHIRESLYLHIDDLKQGGYWRFLTAHLTHYSWTHCLSNIIGLLLLIGIFNDIQQKIHWLRIVMITCIIISSGLMLFSNQLDWYVGFSGILTSLYAYVSIKGFNENIKVSTFILIVLTAYITIQLSKGELISSLLITELKTSSYAHGFGFIAGVLCAVIELCYQKSINNNKF
ncbi:MAG: rhombosortase [Gammaproteobacteria bacterium]